MSGTLYIVATPIGNLEDVTLRAIATLNDADIILCEDTRVTKKLLDFLYTKYSPSLEALLQTGRFSEPEVRAGGHIPYTKLLAYHQHSSDARKLEILRMLVEGKSIALVTDAGTPGISDPGNELISFLLSNDFGVKIVPIPGPSAIPTALSVSGLDINKFVFLGFMPKKKKAKIFSWLKEGKIPFAYYDSPHRVIKNLQEIEKVFGSDVQVFVARELTKIHETLYRGNVSEVVHSLQSDIVKGEVVVVVDL